MAQLYSAQLHIHYLAYTKMFLELVSVLKMGIQANGFSVDLIRPHYVLHNRSKDWPICYIITLKYII